MSKENCLIYLFEEECLDIGGISEEWYKTSPWNIETSDQQEPEEYRNSENEKAKEQNTLNYSGMSLDKNDLNGILLDTKPRCKELRSVNQVETIQCDRKAGNSSITFTAQESTSEALIEDKNTSNGNLNTGPDGDNLMFNSPDCVSRIGNISQNKSSLTSTPLLPDFISLKSKYDSKQIDKAVQETSPESEGPFLEKVLDILCSPILKNKPYGQKSLEVKHEEKKVSQLKHSTKIKTKKRLFSNAVEENPETERIVKPKLEKKVCRSSKDKEEKNEKNCKENVQLNFIECCMSDISTGTLEAICQASEESVECLNVGSKTVNLQQCEVGEIKVSKSKGMFNKNVIYSSNTETRLSRNSKMSKVNMNDILQSVRILETADSCQTKQIISKNNIHSNNDGFLSFNNLNCKFIINDKDFRSEHLGTDPKQKLCNEKITNFENNRESRPRQNENNVRITNTDDVENKKKIKEETKELLLRDTNFISNTQMVQIVETMDIYNMFDKSFNSDPEQENFSKHVNSVLSNMEHSLVEQSKNNSKLMKNLGESKICIDETTSNKTNLSNEPSTVTTQLCDSSLNKTISKHFISGYIVENDKETFSNGKDIKITEESLKKDRKIFDDNLLVEMEGKNDVVNRSIKKPFGFQTANGKDVKITEESLKKARKTFDDGLDNKLLVEMELNNDVVIRSVKKPFGFQTANGKDVKITEESLKKARKIFVDGLDDTLLVEMEGNSDVVIRSVTKPFGFLTASGKDVKITEESLKKYRKTFEDGLDDKLLLEMEPNNDLIIKPFGFQTASGENVTITEESLKKARKTFDDSLNDNLLVEMEPNNDEVIRSINKPFGFDTANGKDVKTTDESLKKARKIFDDGLNEKLLVEIEANNDVIRSLEKPFGFQTASGNDVKITAESLKKARKTFDDGLDNKLLVEIEPNNDVVIRSVKKPFGFQTANGKDVKITEESLKKARKTFEDGLDDKLLLEMEPNNDVIIKPFVFQTASGENVTITEESLKKARQKFGDDLDDKLLVEMEPNNDVVIRSVKKPFGFQTANGKDVKITEESLKKARKIFDDGLDDILLVEKEPNNDLVIKSVKKPFGFQTASGKDVKIKEESLKKARQKFGDDLDDKLLVEMEPNNDVVIRSVKKPFGFQTANGKDVKITEESLKKARKTFEDGLDDKLLLEMEPNNDVIIKPFVFQTASGENVTITEESLKKARKIFDDGLDDKLLVEKEPNNDLVIKSVKKPFGFQTASGKDVKITEESLKKARKTFDDGLDDKLLVEMELNNDVVIRSVKKPFGFQTESGKDVKITEESLKKARQKFGEDLDDKLLVEMEPNNDVVIRSVKKPFGFQTANGKDVKITEESLKKARKIFDDGLDDKLLVEKEPNNDLVIKSVKKPFGFQTASGKDVKITEESLKKARKTFDDGLDDKLLVEMELNNDVVIRSVKKPFGFQTESGKDVKITEESLKKARQKFGEDLDDKLLVEMEPNNDVVIRSVKKPFGFQTANGKDVKITEESLKKARKIFDDGLDDKLLVEKEPNNDLVIKSVKKPFGFQTASGKDVKITEESLKKARKTFDDGLDDKLLVEMELNNDVVIRSVKKPFGFQTASGKDVKITEESLKKARKTFEDGLDDKVLLEMEPNNDVIIKPFGFQTASGENVTITEESFKKARKTFDDSLNDNLLVEMEPNNDVLIRSMKKPFGFQTANGKDVKITEESLKKARKIFDDGLDDKLLVEMEGNNDVVIRSMTKPFGFLTASGNDVKITEESLKKARKIFDDGLDDKLLVEMEPNNDVVIRSVKKSFGFQTANGKDVKFTEESLKKARKIFDDGLDDKLLVEMELNNDIVTRSVKKPFGFQTASGNDVKITEESLNKVRKIFDDGLDDKLLVEMEPNNDVVIRSVKKPFGFQTASGKDVKITEESLKKARKIFDDGLDDKLLVEMEPNNDVVMRSVKKPFGFQTASGKDVKITEESLKKARKTFDDSLEDKLLLEMEPNNDVIIKNVKKPFGFQTASGENVTITEESLKKARKTFDDGLSDNLLVEMDPNNDVVIRSVKKPFGFETPNGKDVKTTDESLKKAKKIFDNCLNEKLLVEIEANNDVIRSVEKPFGFLTANGKDVQITEESLKKARKIFDGGPDDKLLVEMEGNNDVVIKSPNKPFGFQTANGKNVTITEESLKKARKTFDDGLDDKLLVEMEPNNDVVIRSVKKPFGFQTANGKYVKITEESLKKAKKIFDDGIDDMLLAEMEDNNDVVIKSPSKLFGFQTASGKDVTITEESLKKARKTFDDGFNDNLLVEMEPNNDIVIKSPNKLFGFQTARGNGVKITEESLKKARKIFDDGLDDKLLVEMEPNNDIVIKSPNKRFGFQTASGNGVKITKESLKKARKIFDDGLDDKLLVEMEPNNDLVIKSPNKPFGFQTANGKNVTITEESLKKARKTFDDGFNDKLLVEMEPNNDVVIKSPNKVFGFQTASWKGVKISAEAPKKARKTFNDCLDETVTENKEVYFNFISNNHFISELVSTSDKTLQFCKDTLSKVEQNPNHGKLSSEQGEEEDCVNKIVNNSYLDFKTTGVDRFSLSENSLLRTQQLFKDKRSVDFDNFPFVSGQNIEGKIIITAETIKKTPMFNKDGTIPNTAKDNISELQHLNLDFSGTHSKIENNEIVRDNTKLCLKSSEKNEDLKNKTEKAVKDLFHKVEYPFKYNKVSKEKPLNHTACGKNTVICSDDLDMLCKLFVKEPVEHIDHKSLNDSSQWDSDNNDNFSLSVVHEISESTAALLADEESLTTAEQPSWLKSYTCSPSLISDKPNPAAALRCFENDVTENEEIPLSPVLGSNDRFHKKINIQSKKISSVKNKTVYIDSQKPSSNTPVSKFKPPYSTSTPLQNTNKVMVKRQFAELNISIPFVKKSKGDVVSDEKCPGSVIEARKRAAEEQEKAILHSKNVKIGKQCKGSYLLRKISEKSTPLSSYTKRGRPAKFSYERLLQLGIKKSIIELSTKNALTFVFSAKDYYSQKTCLQNTRGIPVGDGGLLILNDQGCVGLTEVTRCFLSSPGVDPSLASPAWVHNHYRWIVHKLGCTERSFPLEFSNRLLTPNNVLLQLKYRYDREIDRCQRPALRKVLERDENAGKTMILFVSSVIDVADQAADVKIELELSDGWYSIIATVDQEMAALVKANVVVVGTKLVIHGAELLNCEQGCDPLEMAANVRLKIYTNSTRRARWDARLGFYGDQKPLSCNVKSILGKGGNIGHMSALVVRVYPMLYLQKETDGKSVILNWKAEQKASEIYKRKRSEKAEKLYSQVQKELQTETRPQQKITRSTLKKNILSTTSVSELYSMLENAPDPTVLQEMLTAKQLEAVAEYSREENNKKLQELQTRVGKQLEEDIPTRVVIPLLKIRLLEPNPQNPKSCILTIWRPPGDTTSLFTEGSILGFYNITASGYRNGELQLTAGRQTRYEQLEKDSSVLYNRQATSLDCTSLTSSHVFNEIDVVGIVTHIAKTTVYITDAQLNLFGIHFWPGLQESGWEDLFTPGVVIAASNLQVRHGIVSWNIPCGYTMDISTFTLHPQQRHLVNAISTLNKDMKLKGLQNILKQSREKLMSLMEHKNSGGVTPTPYKKSEIDFISSEKISASHHSTEIAPSLKRNRSELERYENDGSIDRITNITPKKCHKRSRSELENCANSTPVKPSPAEKRFKILQCYGEPPPLSPIVLSCPSRTIRKPFQVPLKQPVTPDSQPLSLGSDSDN